MEHWLSNPRLNTPVGHTHRWQIITGRRPAVCWVLVDALLLIVFVLQLWLLHVRIHQILSFVCVAFLKIVGGRTVNSASVADFHQIYPNMTHLFQSGWLCTLWSGDSLTHSSHMTLNHPTQSFRESELPLSGWGGGTWIRLINDPVNQGKQSNFRQQFRQTRETMNDFAPTDGCISDTGEMLQDRPDVITGGGGGWREGAFGWADWYFASWSPVRVFIKRRR